MRRRQLWVHLGVSPNRCGHHKQNLRDCWVLMDIHSEGCRCDLRLSGCTRANDFPQQWIWCMNYCSLSLLNHTSYHLHHCIFCLTALSNQRKRWVIQTWMLVHQNNDSTKRSNDLNQTWCQCHPLLLPSHQGQQKQEHTIHQWRKEARGASCIWWIFVPGRWMKLNSNVV